MGVGDLFDDALAKLKGMFSQSECLDQANEQTATLDAKRAELDSTWQPTGLYTPADINSIVGTTQKLISQAIQAIQAAPLSTDDSLQMQKEALDHLFAKSQQALAYIQTSNAATASGTPFVQADDLKAWVVSAMGEVSSALVTASVDDCNMDWLASQILIFQGYFDQVVAFCRPIAGAVWNIAKDILKAPVVISDLLDKVIKVSLIGGGAYLAYLLFFDKKRGSESA